jgi:hypothetical protein
MVLLISVPPPQPSGDLFRSNFEEAEVQRRCDRNRNRSKRRAIYCPVHNCYMDSMSQKYSLFAERPGQLQERACPKLTI